MDFKIVWSDGAIADLQEICSHIAKDNPKAALRIGQSIIDHVGVLASFPFIGPAYPRGSQGPLREIVYRPYRIFYDVSEDARKVEILHVRHGARQEPKFGTG